VLCLIISPNKGLFTHTDDARKRNKFAVREYEVKSNTGDVRYRKFYKKKTKYKFHQMQKVVSKYFISFEINNA